MSSKYLKLIFSLFWLRKISSELVRNAAKLMPFDMFNIFRVFQLNMYFFCTKTAHYKVDQYEVLHRLVKPSTKKLELKTGLS
jgi:hypothetical protein